MQSVIPPGDPSRTVIAGKKQGWRGLAINYSTADLEGLVKAITAAILTSVHLGETEDGGLTFPTMTTAWEPSPAELDAMNNGAKVIVRQLGMPPIKPMMVFVGETPVDMPDQPG